jgi:hypothetical protein
LFCSFSLPRTSTFGGKPGGAWPSACATNKGRFNRVFRIGKIGKLSRKFLAQFGHANFSEMSN